MNLKKQILSNDRGLGDTIERFTKITGIKNVVEKLSHFTGKDCKCQKRRDKLNQLFSYNKLNSNEKLLVDSMISKYREGKSVPIFLGSKPIVKRLDEE